MHSPISRTGNVLRKKAGKMKSVKNFALLSKLHLVTFFILKQRESFSKLVFTCRGLFRTLSDIHNKTFC